LQVTDVKQGTDPALEGFDFYIFEHEMPEKLPTDGVVFFVDPDIAPSDSGFKISGTENLKSSVYLLAEENTAAQAILNYLSVDLISVYKYTKITCDSSYETLMTCNGDPVFIVQNDGNRQIAVMPFSLHYSNLALLPEFTFLLYNMFSYFLPSTTSDYAFAVGEAFSVNARGSQLDVYYSGTQIDSVTTFPATLSFTTPGTYTLSQYTYFDVDQQNQLQTNIFVKIPSSESNIRKTEDGLTEPVRVEDEGVTYDDLLLYLAAALVFLLFAEWLLHTRESI
jgi:hypothetical protein